MFSKEAQALAEPCTEAMQVIGGKECSKCEGCGLDGEFGPPCPICNGTGKVKGKWEWEPEKWQQVIYRGKVDLVLHVLTPIYVDLLSKRGVFIKDLIPLLHWERIKEILEGMGYIFQEPIRRCYGSEGFKCHCVISLNGKRVGWGWGKTRQEAVQLAVIELGERNK